MEPADLKLGFQCRESELLSLIEDARNGAGENAEIFFLVAELQLVRSTIEILAQSGAIEGIESASESSGGTEEVTDRNLSFGVYGDVHSAHSKYLYQLLDILQAVAPSVDEMCEGREDELLDSPGLHFTE